MPNLKGETWYEKAVELIVRHGISLRLAASECGVQLTQEEAGALERRKSFQKALWAARLRFYKELATDPKRDLNSMKGQLLDLAQKLTATGAFDKAANVLFQVAKIEGWATGENTVNVIGGLTPKEISDAKKELEGLLKSPPLGPVAEA